jgi:hypothetical protein
MPFSHSLELTYPKYYKSYIILSFYHMSNKENKIKINFGHFMVTNTLEVIPSSNMHGIIGIVKYHFIYLFMNMLHHKIGSY